MCYRKSIFQQHLSFRHWLEWFIANDKHFASFAQSIVLILKVNRWDRAFYLQLAQLRLMSQNKNMHGIGCEIIERLLWTESTLLRSKGVVRANQILFFFFIEKLSYNFKSHNQVYTNSGMKWKIDIWATYFGGQCLLHILSLFASLKKKKVLCNIKEDTVVLLLPNACWF